MSNRATFLFARPSFGEGWGRLLDFGGALNGYNTCDTGEEADMVALKQDFSAVTDELRAAVAALA